ncbi:hypothetical protein JL722_7661 [Aureococcus anophagefferens]|nr:hypothetical protein JL722_7661 [Aureococcus anophagefferens]
MAMCSPEVSERLVDDGVTVLLEALLASDNPLVLELALVVCYNISLVPGCDVAMVGYQIGSSLMKLLEGLTPDDAGARFPRMHLSTFLLVLGTFFNLSVKPDNRHALETSGLSRACMRIACDLLIPCVTTLVETGHATDGELEQRLLDVGNALCNLSCSHSLNHELVSARGISCLASVARVTAKLDPATTNPEVIMSLHARTARNLSHVHAPHQMHKLHPAWLTDEIEPMMKLLSGDHGAPKPSAARLDDAAACLYNLLTVGGTDLHAADNLSALLTALFKRVDKPQTRSLCAAALIARQGDQEGAHYSDGSVVALFSAMQSEVSGYDAAAAVKAENDAHHSIKDDDATWGDHGSQFEIVTTFDFGQVYPPLAA